MTVQEKLVWDPFHGSMPANRDKVKKPVARIKVPGAVNSALLIVSLLAFFYGVYCFLAEAELAGFVSLGMFGACIGLILLLGALAKTKEFTHWLYFTIAEKNDWSFHLVKEPVEQRSSNKISERIDSVTDAAETGMDALQNMDFSRENLEKFAQQASGTQKRQTNIVRDFLVRPAYERIGILLKASLAQPIPFEIKGLFWGETKQNIPFWMGASIGQTDMTFAAKELKTDARGNTNNQGNILQIVAAYKLNRKTNIHAWLIAELLGRDSRKDLKTESIEFNDCFKISLRGTSDRQGPDGEAELLRVLTPATQATLIDLRKRYKVQMIVDDDVIYISGYDLINIENPEEVAEVANIAAEEFAEAAVSFKHYAE